MVTNDANRAAEKIIAEALRTRATELDLRCRFDAEDSAKLTELPESLGQLTSLQSLNLSGNRLTALPESLGQLTSLQSLNLSDNRLTALPESLGQLTQLQSLNISGNELTALPEWLGQLTQLRSLELGQRIGQRHLTAFRHLPISAREQNSLRLLESGGCEIHHLTWRLEKGCSYMRLRIPATGLPHELSELENLEALTISATSADQQTIPAAVLRLKNLRSLDMGNTGLKEVPPSILQLGNLQQLEVVHNNLTDLPVELASLDQLRELRLYGNDLNPELAAAYKEGLDAVKRYLRAKAEAQVVLNEAKLILIGEGEVGKSCLLGAFRGDPWEEGRPTTHGIEIKPVQVTDPATGKEITLNGWDFGGQRVYRPTHQLFFSAPAVYLVVWKPREGAQQGLVKEWIKLVKHREPDAKILVVATHGGPKERQPDIDRQEIWDIFGNETVIDFFTVESKPNAQGERHDIAKLKDAIARVAAGLPEMGRSVPKRWQDVRDKLSESKEAYLSLERVFAVCKEHKIEEEDAKLLLRICHGVGDLIYYEHDPLLKDIVILKPDWLATAISFVLDDKQTREGSHGLLKFERLGSLWNNPEKPVENRYSAELHPIFLRLMERFDLCYRIAEPGGSSVDGTSLIAQLVPDVRPENDLARVWPASMSPGDEQQVQICRIVETANNQSATAEGLFFQLIVRLHKYSLGRVNFNESVHWQRGLVLKDDTGAQAFLENIGNDVRITVRSPYPQRFLAALTYEAQWLVEDFWKGMRCEVTVPCLIPKPNDDPCKGLFEVSKLLENKGRRRLEVPCPICNEWQSVEQLLGNAPIARPSPIEELLANFAETMRMLRKMREQMGDQQAQVIGRFDRLDAAGKELVSKVEGAYDSLIHALLDEAKEGPRLFSFQPVDPGFFGRPTWINWKFRLTLWCEHSRLPLPELNGKGSTAGVYELNLPREWFEKAAPFLKILTGTLSLMLPVAASATKFVMDDAAYKGLEKELDLGQKSLDSVLKGGEKSGIWLGYSDAPDLEPGEVTRAQGAVLRQLHAWLKEKDPSFGGLVRVQNKRQEFLWVHPQFEDQY